MEIKKDQENLVITPEKELGYAMEGIIAEDWGEVASCLTEFSVKVPEAGLSAADREELNIKLEEIKNALSDKNIPDEHKTNIENFLKDAKNVL